MDTGKEHKLAAARLKLKQYRSKRVRNTGDSSNFSSSQASPTTLSRSSSCEPPFESEKVEELVNVPSDETVKETHLNVSHSTNTPASHIPAEVYSSSLFPPTKPSASDFFNDRIKYAFGEASKEQTDVPSLLDSKENEAIFKNRDLEFVRTTENRNQLESSHSHFSHERESSVESIKTEVPAKEYRIEQSVIPQQQSTVENLKQISMQLEGLVNEADIVNTNSSQVENSQQQAMVRSLEERNSLLARQLQEQQLYGAQLGQQVQHLNTMLLEAQNNNQSDAGQAPAAEELNHVRRQLHAHVQTVGILVAEKTQLESNASDLKHNLKLHTDKVTELEGRLIASRHKVDELEASLKEKNTEVSALNLEKDRLQSQVTLAVEEKERFKMRCTDNELRVAELGERVRSSGKDQQSLQSELAETKTQLHMANIRIEQLRNSSGDSANILDELNTEKKSHQATQEELALLKQSVAQFEAAKAKELGEYQLYTQQLNAHLEQLKVDLAESDTQKQQLGEEFNSNKTVIEELKAKLLTLQQSAASSINDENEREQLKASISHLQKQLEESEASKKQLENDNLSLVKLSEEMRHKVEGLELSLDRQQTGSVDNSALLSKMQSDKVATSRALAQNKILKEQLSELQDGFVMMSNKKLELTEKLERELHLKKGLLKQLTEATERENNMKDTVFTQERELEQLRSNTSAVIAPPHHQENLSTNGNFTEEPKQSSEDSSVSSAQSENSHQSGKVNGDVVIGEKMTNGDSTTDNSFSSITSGDSSDNAQSKPSGAPVKEVSLVNPSGKYRYILEHMKEGDLQSTSMTEVLARLQTQGVPADRTSLLEYRLAQLSSTHSALVTRFHRAMTQVATMNEEKQNLEVTVEQLQLENDTIGDYITIYQFKRGVLSQQMREKDLELDRLRGDRKTLQEKLDQLQHLVLALSREKDSCQSQTLLSGVNKLVTDVQAEHTHQKSLSSSPPDSAVTNGSSEDATKPQETVETLERKEKPESETVTRILNLIKEMEKQPSSDSTPLHPCGLCSGSLITV